MVLMLISLLVSIAAAGMLLWYAGRDYGGLGSAAGAFGFILALLSGITAITYVFVASSWFAAEHKANIINREYGTNYTREEVFWASDVIDTVRELDRRRIEINGDLMRDEVE